MELTTWLGTLMIVMASSSAAESPMIVLPPPQTSGGKPLMQALSERRSTREFSRQALPAQTLSNLLWAAAGVNRTGEGKRTAPSARNWQEIDIYVTTADGAYRYDPVAHALRLTVARDVRALTGVQDFPAQAPVNLVYVANLQRMSDAAQEQQEFYAATDTGFIAQNVYLYCASEGLATVVRGSVDRDALAKALGLAAHERITLAQSVGYPAHAP
jgi:SagB-type dehydrogenase family enzyme